MAKEISTDIDGQRLFLETIKNGDHVTVLFGNGRGLKEKSEVLKKIDKDMKWKDGTAQKFFNYTKRRFKYEKKKIPKKRTYLLYSDLKNLYASLSNTSTSSNQSQPELPSEDTVAEVIPVPPSTVTPVQNERRIQDQITELVFETAKKMTTPVSFINFRNDIKNLIFNSLFMRNQEFEVSNGRRDENYYLNRQAILLRDYKALDQVFSHINFPARLSGMVKDYLSLLDEKTLDNFYVLTQNLARKHCKENKNFTFCNIQ